MSDPTASAPTSSASVDQHRAAAPDAIRCAVLTISDSRTTDTDTSGTLIQSALRAAAHDVVDYRIVPDEPTAIRDTLTSWAETASIQAILTNGGTGIAARDTTYEVISSLLDARIDGFGELFRMLSYAEIGSAAMLSRAVAGVYRGRVLIAMPGSANAVRLALDKLVIPELAHLVYEVTK